MSTPLERVRAAHSDYNDVGRLMSRIRRSDLALLLALADACAYRIRLERNADWLSTPSVIVKASDALITEST